MIPKPIAQAIAFPAFFLCLLIFSKPVKNFISDSNNKFLEGLYEWLRILCIVISPILFLSLIVVCLTIRDFIVYAGNLAVQLKYVLLVEVVIYALIKIYIYFKPDNRFYKIETEEIGLYQKYFKEILEKIDLTHFYYWCFNDDRCDISEINRQYKKISRILTKAENDGLNQWYLNNIFLQYIFAGGRGENYTYIWVKTVLTKKYDFIPNPKSVYIFDIITSKVN